MLSLENTGPKNSTTSIVLSVRDDAEFVNGVTSISARNPLLSTGSGLGFATLARLRDADFPSKS